MLICQIMNVDKYWSQLTRRQKDVICLSKKDLDIGKYWPQLNDEQKDLICMFNNSPDIYKYLYLFNNRRMEMVVRRIVLKSKEKF